MSRSPWKWPVDAPGPRTPVTTLEELATLDDDEMIEGYWSGCAGDPEPGDNRSKSFWHGWRNGTVDAHHREKDWAQAELARVVVAAQREGRA